MFFRFHSIKAKLLLVLLVFGLAPFSVVTFLSIRSAQNDVHQEVLNRLILSANAKTNELVSYFNLVEAQTADLASDRLILEHFRDLSAGDSKEVHAALIDSLLLAKETLNTGLVSLSVADIARGRILASTDPNALETDVSSLNYFHGGLDRFFIDNLPASGPLIHPNAFVASAPLNDSETGLPMGTLIALFDASVLNRLLPGPLGYTPGGEFMLEGEPLNTLDVYIVNHLRQILVPPFGAAGPVFLSDVDTLPVRKCLEDHGTLAGARYANYAGEEVMGVSVCFPEKGWVVLAEVSAEEALFSLQYAYLKFAFIFTLLLLLVVLAALVLSRRVTGPLQQMMEMVHRMRAGPPAGQAGRLEGRLNIKDRDEIGQLARAFNDMTGKLSQSYASLEKNVADKTSELHEKVIKIQEEKARDEAILKSIGEGIVVTDQEGNVTTINRAAQSILKITPSSFIGRSLMSVLPLQDEEEHPISDALHPVRLALKQQQQIEGVYYYSRQDNPFPIDVTVSPVLLAGRPTGSIMVFRDVTKEKEVERMKDEFVSLVSHQLRTPLSAIKWFGEILVAGDVGTLTSEQAEFIGNITILNERMISLVNALLNIARIESGRIIIEPEPTDVGQLMRDVLGTFNEAIQEKQLHMVVSINEHLGPVNVDPKMIREVFSNLISNAIKYTPAGGEISLFVSEKDDEIIFQITDTGYGVPEKDQHKLFRKFFRAANVVSVETEGNGLGLYLVKAIVESSGGRIWFKSGEGTGTTFWFSLPKTGMKAKKGQVRLNA